MLDRAGTPATAAGPGRPSLSPVGGRACENRSPYGKALVNTMRNLSGQRLPEVA